jgi:hypothetical protein
LLSLDEDDIATSCRTQIAEAQQILADADRELTLICMKVRLLDHQFVLMTSEGEAHG